MNFVRPFIQACVALSISASAIAQEAESATTFRLSVELRDGSRIIGKSQENRWEFNSPVLGEIKLPLEKIRSVEAAAKTNSVKITTGGGDTLLAAYDMESIRVETTYGIVKLPVAMVRSVRVTAVGKAGRPHDGLIGLWSGENNTLDSVSENSGSLCNVSFADGVAGKAFFLTPDNFPYGTYCGVQIADRPVYALTRSLTIECWIRPRGNGYIIFCRGDHRPGLDPYCLSLDGHQNLSFGICGEDNSQSASVKTPVDLGSWIHAAGVLDDDTGRLSLYTNGVLAAETSTTVRPMGPLMPNESPGIGIGNLNDGGNNFPFIGEIDEVGLYNRALSVEEINAIYLENAPNAGARAEPLPSRTTGEMPIRRGFPRF
jgi:hypothetical protein